MKKILSFFLVVLVSVAVWQIVANQISAETKQRAREYAAKAKLYCKQNGYRTDYCFLVDFDVHSGKNRFFVWDFTKGKIVYSTICVHGCGGRSTYEKPILSNKPGSKCSSEGRYKVAERKKLSKYPMPCYALDGLDTTCSNARIRGILIHPNTWQFATFPLPAM